MYNIGDKVKEKGRDRVLEVINKFDEMLVLKELNTDELNIITFNENQVVGYIEGLDKQEKTNKISRVSGEGKESIIEYEIHDKEIIFSITKNPLHLSTILKILLHETELYSYKYERVSPFRLYRVYDSISQKHSFILNFIDIKTHEKHSTELIKTNKSLCIEGKFKLFIPDFLELCVDRNLLERVGNGYKVRKKIHEPMLLCTYLPSKPSIRELEKEGFIIPEKYKKQYELMA